MFSHSLCEWKYWNEYSANLHRNVKWVFTDAKYKDDVETWGECLGCLLSGQSLMQSNYLAQFEVHSPGRSLPFWKTQFCVCYPLCIREACNLGKIHYLNQVSLAGWRQGWPQIIKRIFDQEVAKEGQTIFFYLHICKRLVGNGIKVAFFFPYSSKFLTLHLQCWLIEEVSISWIFPILFKKTPL